MKQLSQPSDLNYKERKVCLAIGMFDGVHLGHQQVLLQAVRSASQNNAISVAITFNQHPANIISPGQAPAIIQTQAQRIRTIESLGIEAILIIKFDQDFSLKTGESFIQELSQGFGSIHSICVGKDFMFGHNRDGNFKSLQKLGQKLGFITHGLQSVMLDEQKISSTRIRTALHEGKLDEANKMLGRKFSIEGLVIKGDGKGREIGFPTANLDTKGLILPPNGVYAAHARLNGKSFKAVVNIGIRPTINKTSSLLQVETHLLEFNNEVYGQVIEIEFISRLRDEILFNSIEKLKKQISCDIDHAKNLF